MPRFQSFNKRRKRKWKWIMIICCMIIGFTTYQSFMYVERNLEPALKDIAQTYVRQLATYAITDAISQKLSDEMANTDALVHIEKDADDNIQLISFNRSRQARIITLVTNQANDILMGLRDEPIKIPLGQALDSNILAQIGPNIPIKLIPMGAAKADIYVKLEEAGINLVSVEVYLKIEADVRIVIPFSSDEDIVNIEFPIDVFVIPGEVPQYYFRGGEGSAAPPPISIPAETDSEETSGSVPDLGGAHVPAYPSFND